ncbi:MAG: hypothetical protein ACK5HR_06185 [Mycoplasmatales bacterium]
MKEKKRIKEIREGLEKDIYKKVHKLDDLDEPDKLYDAKTEALANFLPEEEEELKTIELLNQEEVELEVQQEAVVEEYNKFIHKEEEVPTIPEDDEQRYQEIKNRIQNNNPLSTEKIKKEVLEDIDNIEVMQEEEEPTEVILEVETKDNKVFVQELPKESTIVLETDEELNKAIIKENLVETDKELSEENLIPQEIKVTEDELIDEKEVIEKPIKVNEIKEEKITTQNIIKETKTEATKNLEEDIFVLEDEEELEFEKITKKNKRSVLFDIFLFLIIVFLVALIMYLK